MHARVEKTFRQNALKEYAPTASPVASVLISLDHFMFYVVTCNVNLPLTTQMGD